MRLILMVTALVLAATALGSASSDSTEPVDPGTLRFDIGRLDVINARTQEIWQKMRSDDTRREYEDPVTMNSNLRRTVWEFNQLREALCHDRFMVEQSCGDPYVPKWVYESSMRTPSLDELQARQQELADRVVPFWDAACARLEKVVAHNDYMPYCSVE